MSQKPLTAAELRFALALAVGCGFMLGWICCLVLLRWQGVIGQHGVAHSARAGHGSDVNG